MAEVCDCLRRHQVNSCTYQDVLEAFSSATKLAVHWILICLDTSSGTVLALRIDWGYYHDECLLYTTLYDPRDLAACTRVDGG